jgi:hypothetical protein
MARGYVSMNVQVPARDVLQRLTLRAAGRAEVRLTLSAVLRAAVEIASEDLDRCATLATAYARPPGAEDDPEPADGEDDG